MLTWVLIRIDTNMQCLHDSLIIWYNARIDTIIWGGKWLCWSIQKLKGVVAMITRPTAKLNRERIKKVSSNVLSLWWYPPPNVQISWWRMAVDVSNISICTGLEGRHVVQKIWSPPESSTFNVYTSTRSFAVTKQFPNFMKCIPYK